MDKSVIYRTLGASNHTQDDRAEQDFYATDPRAIDLLLEREEFSPSILEPSCGQGHLSRRLEENCYLVHSSDIVDRGYGVVQDFFSYDEWYGDIITNPPYSLAQEFIEHSLKITKPGAKIAMLLKLQFLEGKKRKKFFKKHPPKIVYVHSERIMCAKNGDFAGLKKSGGSAVAYAWYIWENGWQGEPVIRRI
ncbi:MAG: NAD(P)-dependent oxidoreductase [Candidatus Absconditicoccaceae bacterium]